MHTRFLILALLLAATGHAQSQLNTAVSFKKQHSTAGQLLDELNRVPGVIISYSSVIIKLDKKVRLTGEEKRVEAVLKLICNDQPVKYVEQNGKIFLISTEIKKKRTLSGFISDKQSGERLIGASIYLPGLHAGTTSNIYGFYSITVPQDSVPLLITYAGYLPYLAQVNMQTDQALNIELDKNIVMNEMVIVKAAKSQTPERTLTGKTDVNAAFVKSVPALLGESDVLKTLQLLPGIQAGNEGTAGMNIRGGSSDQNLVLLDGVPVYNASHAFGLFSIFNADAVNNVEVLKSGFPSSYGGRLSSVIDVHMKEGDKYDYHGEGGIGLVFSRATFEGPIKKGSSSFLISARRTYADLFVGTLQKFAKSDQRLTPFFTDLNVKANFPTGKKDRLYLSLYMGQDKLRVEEKYKAYQTPAQYTNLNGFSWGNTTAMLRWNHVFNKKLFSNFTFTHSRYRFNAFLNNKEEDKDADYFYEEKNGYFSSIRDWGAKVDFDYLPGPNHFLKAGAAATLHAYQPGIRELFENDNGDKSFQRIDQSSTSAVEYDVYVEDDIRLSARMKTNIGVRFSAFALQGKVFTALQPRVNWLYNLNKGWSVSASYGKMNQFIHLLTNNSVGLPTDLWLPVTPRVPPQYAHQLSAGLSWNYDPSLQFSMEGYYKTLNNVIDFTQHTVFINSYQNWEDMVAIGKGKAYGTEWLARKKKGQFTGLGSYTLSRTTRQFDGINDGKPFPFKFDRRHELKLALVWQPSRKFEASAQWYYSTGYAITLPVSHYYDPYSQQNVNVYEGRNTFRMPAYHRLDLSVKFIKEKKRFTRSWVISVYNAYNRFNPFYLQEIDSPDPENASRFEGVAVFPFFASISYQFKF